MLRPRDLEAFGISGVYLNKLFGEGLLQRPGRGLYTAVDAEPSEHRTIAEVGKRVPHGVVCLLGALQYHHLTTQAPFEVWLAIAEKARLPKVEYPPLRIVRFSGPRSEAGSRNIESRAWRVQGLHPGEDRGRLLQVPQQDRPGRCPGGPAGLLAEAEGHDGRTVAGCQDVPCRNVMRPYLESLT